jgi:hypothetical protein
MERKILVEWTEKDKEIWFGSTKRLRDNNQWSLSR